ncbi:uncharacterized protein LOC129899930 [Solanum dulcamara]|uniref:uncharacterized protein LOC129899930 n=1 Tax=Solanum dulcamara TaxID=45834 RepID=UPI002485A579|nr:uncharacterized protein LOC129899930 [Solanum dulcamara]
MKYEHQKSGSPTQWMPNAIDAHSRVKVGAHYYGFCNRVTLDFGQKSYVHTRVHGVPFSIGERVLHKVSPTMGVMIFRRKKKLIPRFIGPFEVLKKYGEVAHKLAFPPNLSGVHLVFYVSMLKRYRHDDSHVIQWDSIALDQDLSFEEDPITILDMQTRQLRSKHMDSMKVQ